MTMARRDFKGVPVACLVPAADAGRLSMLSGDAGQQPIVYESSPRDIGRVCAVLLSGLSPSDRRTALQIASSESKGEKRSVVPLPALLPDDATIPQLTSLWNGLMLLLLALGTSAADTSVGTVVANAASMGSGVPFASDPMVGERQNEVILAKSILEAALLGDEAAREWFRDNHLQEALQRVVDSAESGSSDADSRRSDAVEKVAYAYDCIVHDKPLGGDALAGGALADFISDAWKGLKGAAGKAISSLGDQIRGVTPKPADDATAQSTGGEDSADHDAAAASDKAASDAVLATKASIDDGVAQAKLALESAKQALESGKENINTYQEKLRSTALQNAKLQWAQALLDAPDDVAAILAAANPNMSDPAAFIQSMLSTLPAAKATGNLGTIKALLYALKSAAAKGDGSADTLYGLISGDAMLAAINDELSAPGSSQTSVPVSRLERQKAYLDALRSRRA